MLEHRERIAPLFPQQLECAQPWFSQWCKWQTSLCCTQVKVNRVASESTWRLLGGLRLSRSVLCGSARLFWSSQCCRAHCAKYPSAFSSVSLPRNGINDPVRSCMLLQLLCSECLNRFICVRLHLHVVRIWVPCTESYCMYLLLKEY